MYSCVRTVYRIRAANDGPARARAIVDRELAALVPRRTLEELELMVSELVSNGIKFAPKDTAEMVTLDLRVDDHVRCGVISRGLPLRDHDRRGHLERWPLKVVAGLADRWGVQQVDERTQIWFEAATLSV